MSFEDKKSNIPKNQQLTLSNDNKASFSKEEEKSDNNQLITHLRLTLFKLIIFAP